MFKIGPGYTEYYDLTDPDYPGGKAVPASSPESIDGTNWRALWFNDLHGAKQAVFIEAFGSLEGISGKPDTAFKSDFLKSILKLIEKNTRGKADNIGGDVNRVQRADNLYGYESIEELMQDINHRRHSIGTVLQQLPNTKSPNEDGLYGIWQDCTHRAYAYRLRQTALPAFTAYAPGANYAAGAVVMWHLTGDDWGLFTANRAITNAPWQLDPVMWDQLQSGLVIEQRFLHGYTEDDFEIGQQLTGGDFAGFWVEAIFVYGGKFFSATGGNRPTFVSGGVAGDERVTLTIAEMPRHDHQIASSTRSNSDGSGASDLRSGTGWNTGFTGGGQSHNNIPPTIAVRYWRRAA